LGAASPAAALPFRSTRKSMSRLCKWAARAGTKLIPRGSGKQHGGRERFGTGGCRISLRIQSSSRRIDEKETERSGLSRESWATWIVARATKGLRFHVDSIEREISVYYRRWNGRHKRVGAHICGNGATRAWLNAFDCVFSDGARAILTRGEAAPKANRAIQSVSCAAVHGDIVASGQGGRQCPSSGSAKESSAHAIMITDQGGPHRIYGRKRGNGLAIWSEFSSHLSPVTAAHQQ